MSNRKRKHRSRHHHDFVPHRNLSPPELQFLGHHETSQQTLQDQQGSDDGSVNPLRSLYIQAHEADITHGLSAEAAAQSLEVLEYRPLSDEHTVQVIPKVGSALIQWSSIANEIHNYENHIGNKDETTLPLGQNAQTSVWVDRYDIRLLLDTTNPTATDLNHPPPASPTGWSDIPSDAEDTFFFTPDEMDEFHREKRRRLLEKSREERLKARLQEDGVDEDVQDEDVWGGSDEEPDEVQKELMRRTAVHLSSSPNPAQLEMRILANHGSDQRFSFLRGRWKRAWNLAKAKVRVEKEKEAQENESKAAGLGVLAGYGSDSDGDSSIEGKNNEDDESDKGTTQAEEVPPSTAQKPAEKSTAVAGSEDMAREARRKRLKLWAESRKAPKDTTD